MSEATEIVHWPGQDTPMCDRHTLQAKRIGQAMGITVSSTPWPVEGTICKNCENEAKKAAAK